MFKFLLALCISANDIEGAWRPISVYSTQVNYVRGYLSRNLPYLFPEMENGKYIIESVMHQIVAGMNLRLTIKLITNHFEFVIILNINPQKQITIKNIIKSPNSRQIIGGYIWQDITKISKNDIFKIIHGTILVYRTKILNEPKTHVIFVDNEHNVFSAVFVLNKNTNNENLLQLYRIF